jgi:GAF domain-containing protein
MNADLHAQALQDAAELLRGLMDVGLLAAGQTDRQALFDQVLRAVRRMARAEAGNLYALRCDQLQRLAWQNDRPGFTGVSLPQPDDDLLNSTASLPGYVAATGQIVAIADTKSPPAGAPYNLDLDPADAYPILSAEALPLVSPSGRCIGVLELFNHLAADGRPGPFPDAQAGGLTTLVSMVAVTLHHALAQDDLKELHLDTIIRLAAVAERLDEAGVEHVRRVSRTSALLARALGLDDRETELIEYASPMHDIGKIGVPSAILLKAGPLNSQERVVVEQHAPDGAKALGRPSNELAAMARQIALTHHERWDGMGYPEGLEGKGIPVSGRIVALADTFDTLLSERCYKEAYGLAKVLITIRSERGKQFDPDVVDAFFEVLDQALLIYGLSDPVAAMTQAGN